MSKLASNQEWEQWGKTDPLYGVASWPNSRKGAEGAWTDEAFYALGAADWSDFRREWMNYGWVPEVAVEIGCGAGRLTGYIAKDFKTVHALDVSEGMIRYAKEHVDASNVTFHHVTGTAIPLPDGSVTGIFSAHVFQHFDEQRVGFHYFQECARALAPGGSLMIHLPMYEHPMLPRQHELLLSVLKGISGFKARVKRAFGVPLMRGTSYNISATLNHLQSLKFQDVSLRTFAVSSNGGFHTFVFCRK